MQKILLFTILIVFIYAFSIPEKKKENPSLSIPNDTIKKIENPVLKSFMLSGERIRFLIRNPEDKHGIVYFNLHDNENTAVAATDSIIAAHSGQFIELQFKGKRWIGGWHTPEKHFWFDPNRIFSDLGIAKTLRAYRSYSAYSKQEVKKLADFITDSLLKDAKMIIAVHNNVKGYSIEKYMPDSTFADDADTFYINPEQSPHDFFYVLDSNFYEFFKARNYNVVLQSDSTYEDDGSLSIYCAQKKIPYINVEAMEGHLVEQMKMLEVLQALIWCDTLCTWHLKE